MHLILLRHGECLGQTDPKFYSDPDSELTPLGKEQSQRTGQILQNAGITHIISSPLQRSLVTASIIAENLGGFPMQVWLELCELQSGAYRGLAHDEIVPRFPLAVLPTETSAAAWEYGNLTYEDVFARCEAIVNLLRATYQPHDCILMVTHGGFANYLLHVILNIPPAQPTWFELGNCAISKIRFVPEPEKERPNWPLYPPVQVEVLKLNDTSHL